MVLGRGEKRGSVAKSAEERVSRKEGGWVSGKGRSWEGELWGKGEGVEV